MREQTVSCRLSHMMLAFFCCFLLTGCFVPALGRASTIKERMKPKSIMIGKDGQMSVIVESTYFRKSTLDETKIVDQYSPRIRRLAVSPSWIDHTIRYTTHTAEGIVPIKEIRVISGVRDPYFVTSPIGFFDDDAEVPENGGRIFTLDKPVPCQSGETNLSLDFSRAEVYSDRTRTRWFAYPLILPAAGGDIVCVGVAVVGGIVMLPVGLVVMGGWAITHPSEL